MSEQNVEIVQRIYAEGLLDRVEGHAELVASQFEFVNPPDAIDPGVRRGQEVADALRSLTDAFDRREHHLLRIFDAGDAVVAQVTFHGRGAMSGVELEQEEAHTWSFREGRLVRFEWGRNLGAALKAVGLDD
jgi:ketosteroid isomerase-like protein